jgi:uncharacterized protein YnzC (UPF0291/DUF896 family)
MTEETEITNPKLREALTKASDLSPEELNDQRILRKQKIEEAIVRFRNQIAEIDKAIEDFNKLNRKGRRRNKKWLVNTTNIRRQTLQHIAIMHSALAQFQNDADG